MLSGFRNALFRKNTLYALLAICGACFISYIVYSPRKPLNLNIVVGKPATQTIRSPQYIEFQTQEDLQKTKKLRTTRRQLIKPIYSIDNAIQKLVTEDIITFFNIIRTNDPKKLHNSAPRFSKSNTALIQQLSLNELIQLEAHTINTTQKLLQNGIKDMNNKRIKRTVHNIHKKTLSKNHIDIISKIAQAYLRPNLFIDEQKTNLLIQEQTNAIKPFATVFKAGEIIISKGELYNNFHINVLKELNLYGSKTNAINYIGIFIITALLFVLFERFLYFFYPKSHKHTPSYILVFILLCITIIFARGLYSIPNLKFIDNLHFLIPLPAMIILLCLLLTPNIALLTGSISSILISLMYQNNFDIFIYLFFASCATTFACHRIYRRSDLVKAGNVIGLINVLVIISIGILTDINTIIWYLYNGIIGFTNGLVCAMLSFAFLPYFEALFKITTSLGLLETANLNHPLLKKLLLNAPGTYQHSLMVANLSEAGAEAIGADVILARNGAYFHDIGKMKRPIFFSENQFSTANPHDNLSPRMSKLIISAHPKDGVELAQKHKLPKILQDIMMEHHGTSLVSFFYSVAKQQASIQEEEDTIQDDFRYPGPKPQTKESGIIMLADATEAAIRSIDKPTLPKIENLIDKVFSSKMTDNQLSESNLTFNNVQKIKTTFISIFKSIYHNRLDYQEEINKIIDETKPKHNET
jgi:cyclic-di-AMP phosphodiesterase PgpH